MDRESKREKILSDKMREVQLKMRSEAEKDDKEEETPEEIEKQFKAEVAQFCKLAEKEFYELKQKEHSRRRKEYFGGKMMFQG